MTRGLYAITETVTATPDEEINKIHIIIINCFNIGRIILCIRKRKCREKYYFFR